MNFSHREREGVTPFSLKATTGIGCVPVEDMSLQPSIELRNDVQRDIINCIPILAVAVAITIWDIDPDPSESR